LVRAIELLASGDQRVLQRHVVPLRLGELGLQLLIVRVERAGAALERLLLLSHGELLLLPGGGRLLGDGSRVLAASGSEKENRY
jgi:hypothetical protein